MKQQNLDRLSEIGYAFDTETAKIERGNIAPFLVCGSIAKVGADPKGAILSPDESLAAYRKILSSGILVGANNAYDNLVMAVYAAYRGIDILPEIYRSYAEDRQYDVALSEKLHALANGHMMRNTATGRETNYSLNDVVHMRLGRDNAKANDRWRLSYALLGAFTPGYLNGAKALGIIPPNTPESHPSTAFEPIEGYRASIKATPIKDWPSDAKQYPIDDAVNTAQTAHAQNGSDNAHDLSNQVFSAWCLHIGSAWGFGVVPRRISYLKESTEKEMLDGRKHFLDLHFLKAVKEKGEIVIKENGLAIKKRIADSHKCHGTCSVCQGWGKIPGTSKCLKSCPGATCGRCNGFGYKPKTCKPHKAKKNKDGVWPPIVQILIDQGMELENGFNDAGIPVILIPGCEGTGYNLDSVPMARTDGGGIAAGRDALHETGNDDLIDYAVYGEKGKILSTYVPWLERGITALGGVRPLNPRPSVLMETGRSGGSTEHQVPRYGGIRECISAADGWVLGSVDWEGAELFAHAQSCIYTVGYSKMGEALNSGLKVHDKLGSEILGVTYSHMVENRKTDKRLGDARQAAKPPNFGFPGLMGAATLVYQQRKQGPDTTAPDGRIYKGLRFCILADGATTCGLEKLTNWKGRVISPTCARCLVTAERIRDVWFETWPENKEYFKYVKKLYETGKMTQHYSKRVRAGQTLCATANGLFQGFTGDMMKAALREISTEMYTKKSSVMYGARIITTIHDEIFFTAREEQASAVAIRVSEIMVEVGARYCPDMARCIKADPALMYHWSKDAEPVWLNGKLMPWIPENEK